MGLRAEIIAIGTEVVMGEVVNSNASWLSQELADLGVDVYFHTAVGDNPKRIQEVFTAALSRSNLILVTGGLGPTDDDLTIKTLADFFKQPLLRDESIAEGLRSFFIARGMPMSPTNLKQADKAADAEFLPNAVGTAPGQLWDVSQYCQALNLGQAPQVIIAMPGVPSEMKHIWANEVIPRLRQRFESQLDEPLFSTSLKFFGIGESKLAETLRDLMAQPSPSVAPYVGQAEVRVRIAAKGRGEAEAQEQIQPVVAEIKQRLSDYCYGQDEETLESVVAGLLRQQNLTLSVAESCTGGLISSRLTDVAGSSNYTRLNVVTYANEAKSSLIHVPEALLAAHGAVSPEVAMAMADGVRTLAQTDLAMAITGIAGPDGGSAEKPVGLAYIAISGLGRQSEAIKITVNSRYERTKMKVWFSQYALFELYKRLKVLPGVLAP